MKKETGKNRQGLQMAAYDLRLLFPVLFLVGIGIVMIYSSSSALALEKYKTDYYFLVKQGIFSAVGMVALVFCRHFPYRFYRSLVYPILVLSWLLLLAVLVTGLGHSAGGALRWLRFGFFSFQPSEFARFALIIYLAYSMSKKGSRLKSIGTAARKEMEAFLGTKVFLQLTVKVKEKWRDNRMFLKEMGYI